MVHPDPWCTWYGADLGSWLGGCRSGSLWLGFLVGGARVELLEFAVLFAATGLAGGAAFAGVLGIAEGNRPFPELSLRRFAGWGSLVGLCVSLPLVASVAGTTAGQLLYVSVLTSLGAGSAAGALALARRSEIYNLLEAEKSANLIDGS